MPVERSVALNASLELPVSNTASPVQLWEQWNLVRAVNELA